MPLTATHSLKILLAAMNAPNLTEDENLGLYQRATETGAEWWRVTVADRPENYRLEHGVDDANGRGSVDIDLVVDAENLRAKLKKWRREGFAIDADNIESEAESAGRVNFMPELQRGLWQPNRNRSRGRMKTVTKPPASAISRCRAAPVAPWCHG
jgi:cobaltochelatase CobS